MSAKPVLDPLVDLDASKLHQLRRKWTFYYLIPNRQVVGRGDWASFLEELHPFNYFEDFFAIQNTIVPARDLPKGCRYYVFSHSADGKPIKPLWEHEQNIGGWQVFVEFPLPEVPRNKRGGKPDKSVNIRAEEQFYDLCCVILGASKDVIYGNAMVNGIEFNCRGQIIKVGLWVNKKINEKQGDLDKLVESFAKFTKREVKKEQIVLEAEHQQLRAAMAAEQGA